VKTFTRKTFDAIKINESASVTRLLAAIFHPSYHFPPSADQRVTHPSVFARTKALRGEK